MSLLCCAVLPSAAVLRGLLSSVLLRWCCTSLGSMTRILLSPALLSRNASDLLQVLGLEDLPEGVLCEVEHRSWDTTAEYHLRPTPLLSQCSPLQVACIRKLRRYMELHSGLGSTTLRIAHDPGEVWHAYTDFIASLSKR